MRPAPTRLAHGDHPAQWVEVTRPAGESRGVVAVVHGGFWKAAYTADLARPLARDLAGRGWTTLTVEYRRVGDGGGFPATFDDVHAALGLLDAPTTHPLVALGHSAGGHLAAWAAARGRFARWAGGAPVTHVVSQAGVLDLSAAYDAGLGGGAVRALMGAGPDDAAYELADPARHLPLAAPVWCLHAPDDDEVPIGQSRAYVARARAAGAAAELVEVTGGHYDLIDPASPAWTAIVAVLDEIG